MRELRFSSLEREFKFCSSLKELRLVFLFRDFGVACLERVAIIFS